MLFPASRLSSIAALSALSLGGLGGFARPATAETISVVGTLTSEGVECPAMKGDDGKLYSLTPSEKIGLAAAGTRIQVEGTVAEMSICQQGITIEVTKVEPAE
jgi:Protein of unknown function (DUF5818)